MDIPDWVYEADFQARYRQTYGLTVTEYEKEPWEAKWYQRLRWSLEDERAKLDSKRSALNSGQ